MKTIIGLCGNIGSFSEQASMNYIQKEKIKDYELKYLVVAEKVLKELSEGKIDIGIFPIENSNGGIVFESVYAMSNYNFNIEKIFEIDVQHCLMLQKGAKIEDIQTISSHPQALKQCRMYLKRTWKEKDLVEYADTAQAAKDLGEGKLDKTTAIIAPIRCAELYGLEVAEEGIQDLKFNFTTFIAGTKK